ncbi:MAG: DUF1285 domain-containing protein [Candidatus Abyssobacteria bacterium SURF_5]|uniref:DUF1285 domain-containing protein n=1 Tax=Abyssobacteria bacterium (strain SURF_5) TaxID=2093360 RepID=A0A3A4NIV3_ABYX5|nr:MAG: DUF1285 domain-containing protein [Candidatus Abyssubacteria bacterium SURF_5]
MSDSERAKRSKAVEVGKHIGTLHLREDAGSPYELRIDSEGRWFHGGVEIVRQDILQLFSRNLRRSKGGAYYVRLGRDEAPVVVDDVPFVVVRLEEDASGKLGLLLSDGVKERLKIKTLTFSRDNIPFCSVRGNLEAKFSRQAYYQLAAHIEYDEQSETYYVRSGGERRKLEIPIRK